VVDFAGKFMFNVDIVEIQRLWRTLAVEELYERKYIQAGTFCREDAWFFQSNYPRGGAMVKEYAFI
jgi:hypothetical protein